jgi:hypothetical protein
MTNFRICGLLRDLLFLIKLECLAFLKSSANLNPNAQVVSPVGGEIVAEPAASRYRAFLSYTHHDTAWAKWLLKALESYRVDKDLVGRDTLVGPVPRTLRPIFRDREDFPAGHTLTAATVAAVCAENFVRLIW